MGFSTNALFSLLPAFHSPTLLIVIDRFAASFSSSPPSSIRQQDNTSASAALSFPSLSLSLSIYIYICLSRHFRSIMSIDLTLKPSCGGCGSTSDLYGSNCKHLTLCLSCGKTMAENNAKCYECGVPITKLIREYNVRASTGADKNYYIGRFVTGLPPFSKKKSAENKWILQKEGLQGRQITDALREKYKNKPWILEDETGQHQYQGHLEGAQSASYYLLMMQGKEFVAIPAGSWYNFNKIAQYKQLTLEEAEEKMNKRKNNATGYERWMMKAATNGPAAFGDTRRIDGPSGGSDITRPKKAKNEDDGNQSDHADEDGEEEEARKNRLGLNKKGEDDDEEDARDRDLDLDDDDIEKGDDWEHEEIFTDDDEAVGNDPEEREDLAPEIPAPPEIKQDENDESEEEGGLSKSGKELQKLLGRTGGLNESDAEDGEDDEDVDDETDLSPVLAPKQKDTPKEELADTSPSKTLLAAGSSKGTASVSKVSKSKRKSGSEDAKNGAPTKKAKPDNEQKQSSVKDEVTPAKPTTSSKASASTTTKSSSIPSVSPVTEEEIRNVLRTMGPIKTQDLVAKFKPRLQEKEDKNAFAEILKRISKIQKTNGSSYVVLKDK